MILVWLILSPLIGGLLCWLTDRFGPLFPRWIALLSTLSIFVLGLYLWGSQDFTLAPAPGPELHWACELQVPWIPRFGISFHLAMDGLSLLMVTLTGLLGVLSVLCSWREIDNRIGVFHLNLLWLLSGVTGIFLAVDMFLFFVFWEIMLVPMFFLIALWGHDIPRGKSRIFAATKFFIFTQTSGLVMLLAILGLVLIYHQQTGHWSFDFADLLTTKLSERAEWMLMLGFFVAFAVKFPVVPLHSWLPDAHSQAPTAGSVDLAGILLKTAAFGLLRFALPMFPHASAHFAPVAFFLGAFAIIYGALASFAQTDIKRLVAYSSISHMGFVLIAIYSGNPLALEGAVMLMIAHGLSSSGLFILCGQLYERLHTRDFRLMGGLWKRIIWLPALSLFFAIASLGLPGTANFVAEFLVLVGSFQVTPVTACVAAIGLVLSSAYSLIMIHRAYFGPTQEDTELEGLTPREYSMILVLAVLLIVLGIYPQPVLDTAHATMHGVQQWFGSTLALSALPR